MGFSALQPTAEPLLYLHSPPHTHQLHSSGCQYRGCFPQFLAVQKGRALQPSRVFPAVRRLELVSRPEPPHSTPIPPPRGPQHCLSPCAPFLSWPELEPAVGCCCGTVKPFARQTRCPGLLSSAPWPSLASIPGPQQAAGAQRPLAPCILSDAKLEASCWNFPFGLQGTGPPFKDLGHRWNHTHTHTPI